MDKQVTNYAEKIRKKKGVHTTSLQFYNIFKNMN